MDIFVGKLKDFLENKGYKYFISLEELRSEMPSEVREILYNLGEKFESILRRYPVLFELRKYGNGTTKVRLKSYDNKFNHSSVCESSFAKHFEFGKDLRIINEECSNDDGIKKDEIERLYDFAYIPDKCLDKLDKIILKEIP